MTLRAQALAAVTEMGKQTQGRLRSVVAAGFHGATDEELDSVLLQMQTAFTVGLFEGESLPDELVGWIQKLKEYLK